MGVIRHVGLEALRAEKQRLRLPVELERAPEEKVEAVAVFLLGRVFRDHFDEIEPTIVGALVAAKAGLEAGRYEIELDLSALGSGTYRFDLQGLDLSNRETPLFSETVDLKISDLVRPWWAGHEPALEVRNLQPTITNLATPWITFEVDRLLQSPAGKRVPFPDDESVDPTVEIEVFLNDREVTAHTEFDGRRVTLWPPEDLLEGSNRIAVEAQFSALPRRLRAEGRELVCDRTPPTISLAEDRRWGRDRQPDFLVHAEDRGTGVDPASLELTVNGVPLDVAVTPEPPAEMADGSDGAGETLRVRVGSDLWEGRHRLAMTIRDRAGNRSSPLSFDYFVDTVPPKIRRTVPADGECIAPAKPGFSVLFSDDVLPAVARRPVEEIFGIGPKILPRFHQAGIERIDQLLDLRRRGGAVDGVERYLVMQLIEKARLIKRARFDGKPVRSILHWPLTRFLETEPAEVARLIGTTTMHINSLHNALRPVSIALDPTAVRRLRLGDLSIVEGTGVADSRLYLDDREITDRCEVTANAVRCDYGEHLQSGHHELRVEFSDRCGNRNERTIPFRVDAEPPEILDLEPADGALVNQVPLFISARLRDSGAGVDPGAIRLSLDGIDQTPRLDRSEAGFSLRRQRLAEGEHRLQVQIADRVGNRLELTSRFFYDTRPPRIEVDSSPDRTAIADERVQVSGRVFEPGIKVYVRDLLAEVAKDLAFHCEVPLEPGANALEVVAEDAAGNRTPGGRLLIFRVTAGSTAIYGTVRDRRTRPLAGARVTVEATGSQAVTDAAGRFCLYDRPLRGGRNRIRFEPPAGRESSLLPVELTRVLRYGEVQDLGRVFLLDSRLADGTEVPEASGETRVEDLEGRVRLVLPNDGLCFPPGASSRRVAVHTVGAGRAPALPGGGRRPRRVAILEPEGLRVESPAGAPLRIANEDQLAAGSLVPLLSYEENADRWSLATIAQVSHDGRAIETLPGRGLRHFSLVAPLPPQPVIEVLREDRAVAGAESLKGGLELDIELPSFRYLDGTIRPRLKYSSLTAAPAVTFSGVFRGMSQLREFEEITLPPPTEMRGRRFEALQTATAWRQPNWLERILGKDSVMVDSQISTQVCYVPEGGDSPFTALPTRVERDGAWIEYSHQLVSEPRDLLLYRMAFETVTLTETETWPSEVSSKYYCGHLETPWQKIIGEEQRVEDPLKGFLVLHRLPPDFSIRQTRELRFADGRFFPTGLYSFLARYRVEFQGKVSQRSSTVVQELTVDEGFLAWLAEQSHDPAAQRQLEQLEAMAWSQRWGETYASQFDLAWHDALDPLFRDEAGSIVVENLRESPFGRGWALPLVQTLTPVGRSRALVIGEDERLVFSLERRVQTLLDLQKVEALKDAGEAFGHFVLLPGGAEAMLGGGDKVYRIALATGDITGSWQLPGAERVLTRQGRQSQRIARDVYVEYYTWETVWKITWIPVLFGMWPLPYPTRQRRGPHRRYDHTAWDWQSPQTIQPSTPETIVQSSEVSGMAVDATGTVYVADVATHRIFQITPEGDMAPICGRLRRVERSWAEAPIFRCEATPGSNAWGPWTATLTGAGRATRQDWTAQEAGEEVDTTYTPDGERAEGASIFSPAGLAVDAEGNVVFSERGHHQVRRIRDGRLETVAGSGAAQGYDPAVVLAREAALPEPSALCADAAGNLYCRIEHSAAVPPEAGGTVTGTAGEELSSGILVQIDVAGYLTRLAGCPTGTITPGVDARLFKIVGPTSLAVDLDRSIVLSLEAANRLLRITPQGFADELAGSGRRDPLPGDGARALAASLAAPGAVQVSANGNLLVLDTGHGALRQVDRSLFGGGDLRLQGPAGYFDSRLERLPDGRWVRIYKDGRQVSFDAAGRQTRDVDRNGNLCECAYDDAGRLVDIRHVGAGGQREARLTLAYDAEGRLASIRDHLDRLTGFTVEGRDLVEVRFPDGRVTRFDYLEDGKLVRREEA